MLVALSIRDIVLIDRLAIDFSSGMTVLTGETGAGKSILLDALSLALGGRGDSALVRHGAGQGQGDVTAASDVTAAKAEADYLAASVDELNRLAPEPGEEEVLADRRQQMMRAEKIAGDINDAYDTVGGSASPLPTLASLVRRLERKGPEAAGLL